MITKTIVMTLLSAVVIAFAAGAYSLYAGGQGYGYTAGGGQGYGYNSGYGSYSGFNGFGTYNRGGDSDGYGNDDD